MSILSTLSNEKAILASLVKTPTFMRKVIPFLKPMYFADRDEQKLFVLINDYITKFNDTPNKTTLSLSVRNDDSIGEKQTETLNNLVKEIFEITPPSNEEFLLKTSEQWVKDREIHIALNRAVDIQQGNGKKGETISSIPDILSKALGVCFDNRVGMDFALDIEARWDYYTNEVHKIPFDLDIFNQITKGGIPRKTINFLVASVNVGKSMGLIHLACMYMKQGLNVLYISNEMREEEVFKRVDANLLNIEMDEIVNLGKNRFVSRVESLKEKTRGILKVKEYASGASSTLHYKHLINELGLKQNFIPDVILVDYIGITASANFKQGSVGNYDYYKNVAVELRAMAFETNTIVWTAAQFNRGGMTNEDADMEDLAESKAIADTADGMWSLTRSIQLDALGQIMVKQLKSRYNDKAARRKFVIGVNVYKQLFFDVEQPDMNELNPEKHQGKTNDELQAKFSRNKKEEDKPLNSFGNNEGFGGFKF